MSAYILSVSVRRRRAGASREEVAPAVRELVTAGRAAPASPARAGARRDRGRASAPFAVTPTPDDGRG